MSIFTRLQLENWRQFGLVDLSFHPRLTILTGANGAGKTTILHLLNRHWGWNIAYVSTPLRDKRGVWRYWAGFWGDSGQRVGTRSSALASSEEEYLIPEIGGPRATIGRIEYEGHDQSTITVPTDVSETFGVEINPQPSLPGVYVPSHRPLYLAQKVEEIPTNVDAKQQIFDIYLNEIRNRWKVMHRVHSPSHMLKRSLISLATFGYGNDAVQQNAEARKTFEGFQSTLRIVLPKTLGFNRLRVHVPDVVLETSTGNFAFDAVSGGVSALIDVAWQVYLYSTLVDGSFVVAIDEPEAHLHPAMQRSVLPDLLKAFPKAQFIVATHNPLIVGSEKESSVYVLRYNEDRQVVSELLDQVNKAGTANELLRDVLGLESTSAIWVEGTLREIIGRYQDRELNRETLAALRQELNQLGLAKYVPETIDRLTQ